MTPREQEQEQEQKLSPAHEYRLRLLVERMVDEGYEKDEIEAAVTEAQVDRVKGTQ